MWFVPTMELLYLCTGYVVFQWSVCGIWKHRQTDGECLQNCLWDTIFCLIFLAGKIESNLMDTEGDVSQDVSQSVGSCILSSPHLIWQSAQSTFHYQALCQQNGQMSGSGECRQVHWTGMCQSLQNCGLGWSMGLLSTVPSALVNPPEDVRTSCMLHWSFVLVRIHFPLWGSTMRTFWSSVQSVWPGMVGIL